jgi:uncharacterized membrane protein (UPF0136 family)
MASTTVAFGLLLTLLGLAGYFLTGTSSVTALIPAFLGVILIVLGILARADHVRKHAMHAAATVALLGFVGALFSLLRTPIGLRPAMAVLSQAATVLLTGVFLALCVRSFIDARRARRAG